MTAPALVDPVPPMGQSGLEPTLSPLFSHGKHPKPNKYLGGYHIHAYEVPIPRLPSELDGLTILHISDLHFHGLRVPGFRLPGLGKVDIHLPDVHVARIKFLHALRRILSDAGAVPDIVALTGDYVRSRADELTDRAIRALAALFLRAHRVFVPGNHDYESKNPKWIADRLHDANFENLTNRAICVKIGGRPVHLVGLDDHMRGKPKMPELDSSKLHEPRILLMHNIDSFNNLDSFKEDMCPYFDLVLSGHTHGGEMKWGPLDGIRFLIRQKAYLNRNGQTRQFKPFGERTISHVTPCVDRHIPNWMAGSAPKKGVSLLRLRAANV